MKPAIQAAAAGDAGRSLRIAAGAQALALELSERQVELLARYVGMLLRWNDTYNLTAVRDPNDMISQHILDCLAAAAALRRRRGDSVPGERVLDAGTGAGLPGVVIALVAPERQVVCVDSVGKKIAFVTEVAGQLGLKNVEPLQRRVEDMDSAPFDVVTSRAFASLSDFVQATRELMAADGVWMAMKGKLATDELSSIAAFKPEVEAIEVPGLQAERCIVWIPSEASARSAMDSVPE